MVMLSDDDGQIFLQRNVKLLANGSIMAEIRELPIDTTNDLDIIMLDILQILLLQHLGIPYHLLVQLPIGSRGDIIQPVLQVVVVCLLIAQETH